MADREIQIRHPETGEEAKVLESAYGKTRGVRIEDASKTYEDLGWEVLGYYDPANPSNFVTPEAEAAMAEARADQEKAEAEARSAGQDDADKRLAEVGTAAAESAEERERARLGGRDAPAAERRPRSRPKEDASS